MANPAPGRDEQLVAARSTARNQADEAISRVDFYAEHLRRDAAHLPADVKYLAVDGCYPKLKFVTTVRGLDLHLVSKLRHDANLRYLYQGSQKQSGAKRKYAGKVNFDDLIVLSMWVKLRKICICTPWSSTVSS